MSKTLSVEVVPVLVEFLLERLADDEAELRELSAADGDDQRGRRQAHLRSLRRLTDEVVAKRDLIEDLAALASLDGLPNRKPVQDGAISALRALTLPYVDHLDYDPEWTAPRRR